MNKHELTIEIIEKLTELLEVTKDIREFMPRRKPSTSEPPQLVDNIWVMEFLGIKRTAFYENVWRKELTPVRKVGRKEYYDKKDVFELLRKKAA
ncbi:hypothetical protein [Parapedobacter sp. 2B3]|uniref:hypothetical protein n=1 Tax=Parapedobacter sp. 2B3 TaxID=3342381 RepID=UPI0035B5AB48